MSRAVVLLQLGGPDTPEAIEPFLANLFADPYTIPLPWWLKPFQPRLARVVAKRRAPLVADLYRHMGGASPILANTVAQARALEAELACRGASVPVHVAMRCWHPLTEHVVDNLLAARAREVTLLPLYPQESSATTGSAVARFEEVSRERGAPWEIRVARSYPVEPGYVAAIRETVHEALARFENPGQAVILFSAHSLPMVIVAAGDPYPEQIAATRAAVEAGLGLPNRTALSFQSQAGPVKWLGPTTHDAISALAGQGVRDLLLVPLGFVSEHLETLYEMDVLYGEHARSLGMRFERAAAPGTHPAFIGALADVVARHV
ncbi:MAG: ferrochelatase [Candidatus Sericytochromatia bacterium]|nr:ferrochelatase [Candidatus Tanganyikabacteria bacterium]